MAVIQALPAQQRPLVAVAHTSVVLRHHGHLVLGGKRAPTRLVDKSGRIIAHRFIMGALHQQCWHGHLCLPVPVSPLRDDGLQQVSQIMLTERDTAVGEEATVPMTDSVASLITDITGNALQRLTEPAGY